MKRRFYRSGKFKGKSYWEVLENMFYLPKMQRVIDDLRQGRPSRYYPYTRETGTVVEQKKTVHPAQIVIFDTMMLFDQMDLIIVVEVSRENILKRKVQRDRDIRTETEIVQMHQQVQGAYWDRYQPQNPDIRIDNNDFNHPKIIKR
jgi:uridine kinase